MSNAGTRPHTAASLSDDEIEDVRYMPRGSPKFDFQRAQYKPQPAFRVLEELLKDYLKPKNNAHYSIDDIIAETCATEDHYTQGSGRIRKAWLALGDRAETFKAWIEFIPEDYGLKIVKAGFGVILQMAQESADNRDRIIHTFQRVSDTVSDININSKILDWDKATRESALDLFGAIADILVELLKFGPNLGQKDAETDRQSKFSMSKVSRIMRPNGSKQNKISEDQLDELLVILERRAARLQSTISSRRDKTIMDIKKITLEESRQASQIRYTTKSIEIQTRQIGKGVETTEAKVEQINETLLRAEGDVKQMNRTMQQQAIEINQIKAVMERLEESFLRGTSNMHPEELNWLMDEKQQCQDLRSYTESSTKRPGNNMLGPLISLIRKELTSQSPKDNVPAARKLRKNGTPLPLEGFMMLLASREDPQTAEVEKYDIKIVLAQPHKDIKNILSRAQDFDAKSQGQAQSLVKRERFLNWMTSDEPDMLLVDGNLSSSESDNISAISLFCATAAVGLSSRRPNDVFLHFFCGLHTSSNDWFYGPNGLVRSLIIQILRALDLRAEGETILDFINSRRYIKQLKAHDLDALCVAVEELTFQFPAGTNIYCIIDGLSVYDKNYQGLFEDMKFVLGRLEDIISTDTLGANFKILYTAPGRSTRRMKELVQPNCHIELSPNNLNMGQISEYSLRASLPTPNKSRMLNIDWE